MLRRASRTPQGHFLHRTVRRGRPVQQKARFCTARWDRPSQDRLGPGFRAAKSKRSLRAQGFGDMPGTRIPPNGLTKKCSSEHRRGRGTLPQQSRKATPGGAAQAARRSDSEMSQTSKQRRRPEKACRSPRTRTPLNGLTKKCSSEHRRGRGTLPRQSRKAT